MNIAFFASHRGSNMQAVIDACKTGRLNARACVVISNNGDSDKNTVRGLRGMSGFHGYPIKYLEIKNVHIRVIDF